MCIFNFAILAYASIQKGQIDDVLDEVKSLPIDGGSLAEEFNKEFYKDYLIAVPCIIAFGFVAMCFIAWKLYQEFAWSIYKHISADLRLKRRYLAYQVYDMSFSYLTRLLTVCGLDLYYLSQIRSLLHPGIRSSVPCCCQNYRQYHPLWYKKH